MTLRHTRVRGILLAAAFAVAVGSPAACTTESSPGDSAGVASATSAAVGPTIIPEMPRYLRDADKANVSTPNTMVAISARPTVILQNSQLLAMTIRDEGREEWKAGNYRLVVYCVGNGTLYAHFKLGATSEIKEIPECVPTITTGAVDLSVPSDTSSSSVLIIPAGNAQAAVAYQIQRM